MTDTMMLTIRDVPTSLVHSAKLLTGKGTGSQAFMAAVELSGVQTETIADLRAQVAKLKIDLSRSRSLLVQLAPLCIQVAELAGQKDIFD